MPACQKYSCTTIEISHQDCMQEGWVGPKDTDGTLTQIEVLASTALKQGRLAGRMGRYSRNPAVSINHLLKRIVRFEKNIYVLHRG